MAKTVRINDLEDEAIRKKAIEINKKLVEYGNKKQRVLILSIVQSRVLLGTRLCLDASHTN